MFKKLLVATIVVSSVATGAIALADEKKPEVIIDGPSCKKIINILEDKNVITLRKQLLLLELKSSKFRKELEVEIIDIEFRNGHQEIFLEGFACGRQDFRISGILNNSVKDIMDLQKGNGITIEFYKLRHAQKNNTVNQFLFVGTNLKYLVDEGISIDKLPEDLKEWEKE